jgi:curved DNA-binding protein CbpA
MDGFISSGDSIGAINLVLSPNTNAFACLGVTPGNVNPSHVKQKYYAVSTLIHPDKCTDLRANDAFKVVGQAKESLLDPSKVPDILLEAGVTGEAYLNAIATGYIYAPNIEAARAREEADEAQNEVNELEGNVVVAQMSLNDAEERAKVARNRMTDLEIKAKMAAWEAEKVRRVMIICTILYLINSPFLILLGVHVLQHGTDFNIVEQRVEQRGRVLVLL